MKIGLGIGICSSGGGLPSIATFYGSDVYHLDPALQVTKDGGDRVSAWVDQSKGQTISRGGVGNEPLWLASATPAGKPAMHLDATNRFFTASLADLFSTSNFTLVAVVKEIAATYWFQRSNAGQTAATSHQLRAQGGNTTYTSNTVNCTAGAQDTTNFRVLAWRIGASSFGGALTTKECLINGVAASLTGSPVFPNTPGAGGALRMGVNGVSGGQIADLIWCEGRLLDTVTISRVLGAKHGITVA